MAKHLLANTASTSVSFPDSGVTAVFVDTDENLKTKDSSGYVKSLLTNFSTVAQSIAAATRTYIAGSQIAVPPGGLQVGSMFRWTFNMTKTAAGTAASTFDIAIGTAGTTSDSAKFSFTKPAGTAVVDEAFVTITAVVRSIGTGGVISAEFTLIHSLQNTGHAVLPCVVLNSISSGFDMTVANLFIGLCATTGASDVITVEIVTAEAWNL